MLSKPRRGDISAAPRFTGVMKGKVGCSEPRRGDISVAPRFIGVIEGMKECSEPRMGDIYIDEQNYRTLNGAPQQTML